MATVRDRGRVRKEKFEPYSLRFAIEDTARPIHLLVGHSYGQPLAVRAAVGGSSVSAPAETVAALKIEDTDEGVNFEAEIADEDELPSYYLDLLKMFDLGLVGGLYPGFTVPPATVVPDAEKLIPEPGNPGVQIRSIRQAVLHELSLVTRPAYDATELDLRGAFHDARPRWRTPVWL